MIFDVPKITEAVKDSISPDRTSVIYNVDNDVFEYYDGARWTIIGADVSQYTNEATGFPIGANGEVDRTSSSISFNEGSRVFTISGTNGGYSILLKDKIHFKTGAQTTTISNTEGMHYIYFDDAGSLTSTTTFTNDLILRYVYVASIYYDAENGRVIHFGDERHGCVMDGATHLRIHLKDGAIFVSGMALSSFSVDGNGNSNSHAQFEIGSGAIRDEDIPHSLSAIGATTAIPVLYKISTNWRKNTTANFKVFPDPTTGRLYYNNSGALTAVTNNKFVLYHIVATNDVLTPFVSIMGTMQYDTKSEARVGAVEEIKTLSGLPFVEFVFIGTVIFETKDSYTNSVKARIVSTDTGANYVDWRFSSSGINPTTVNLTAHNNLGGVQGGSGGNYYHSDQPINTTDSVTFSSLTLSGDLTVNGTTTNINTTNLVVEDKNIILGDTSSPSDITADGGGITLKGTTDKTFMWVDSTDSWTSSEHLDLTIGKTYKINNTTVLSSTQVLGKTLPGGDIVGTSDSQSLSNKSISLGSNTISGTTAQFNTALSDNDFSTISGAETLSNKTLNLSSNTLTGTTAQFNTALSDNDFSTISGAETLSNKSISLGSNTISGTTAQFNTALSDNDFSTISGAETLSNKTISGSNNTLSNIGNASLSNSAITINGSNVSLGGSITISTGGGSSTTFSSATNFDLGTSVYYTGAAWAAAIANNDSTLVQYIISEKTGSGPYNYTALASGEITLTTAQWDARTGGSGGLTAGSTYYLSSTTAGRISTTPGLILAPVLRALSTTKAFISLSINSIESGMGDTFYRDTTTTVATTSSITLTYPPAGKAYVWLAVDGVLQSASDFSLAGTTLTLGASVPSGTLIDVTYARAVLLADTNAINKMVAFSETVTGSAKTVFNLPSAPSGVNSCIVFVGGAIQDTSKWNLSGNVLTLLDSVPVGVQVVAYVLNSSGISTSLDSFVTRATNSLAVDGTVNISTLFGSQTSGAYRFFDATDPRISGTIFLKHNGTGVDPDVRVDSNSGSVSIVQGTASKLNVYISGNLVTLQNKTSGSISLRMYKEI